MEDVRIDRQLERIRQLQSRLNRILQDETLDGLELLADELRSRMATLIQLMQSNRLAAADLDLLNTLVSGQREIISLMERRLQTFSDKLMAARKTTMVNKTYRIIPAKINAGMVKSMDLKG